MDTQSIFEKIKGAGIDFTKIPEYVKKIKEFIPTIKSFFPIAKQWEKTQNLEKSETLIYSAMITEEEVFFYGFAIKPVDEFIDPLIEKYKSQPEIISDLEQLKEKISVIISDEKFKMKFSELVEKMSEHVPFIN